MKQPSASGGHLPEGSEEARLGARLRDRLAEAGVAGAAAALWSAGRMTCAGAGLANVAERIEAEGDTIFQIGSITKVFTATLLMMLAEEGRVVLEAPVARYLPEFRIAGGAPPDSLAVLSLIDYTSGIAGDFFADFGPGPDALARYVKACADLPLLFAPGTMRGYSSTAYCIAGRVVEAVTGETYEAALAARLLRPLGMERFAFYTHDVARYRTAVGHIPHEGGFTVSGTLRLPHAMSASGASLTTSAADLARFGLMHLREGRAESGAALLSPASVAAMIGPARHVPPGESPVRIGWAAIPFGTGKLVCASGETVHQNAFLAFSREHDLVIAILANTSGGAMRLLAGLGCDLIEEACGTRPVLPAPAPAARVPAEGLERYAGEFTNHTRLSASVAGEALAVRLRASDPSTGAPLEQSLTLVPVGEHRFVAGAPEQPAAVFEFLFMDGPDLASHITSAGRIFARCDAEGRTRWR